MHPLHVSNTIECGHDTAAWLQVGIASENCAEWVIVDHACAKYSLVSVPLETHGTHRTPSTHGLFDFYFSSKI